MSTFRYFLYIPVLFIEIVFSASNFGSLSYFSPLVILALILLILKKENSVIILIFLGTVLIDMLNSRHIGLVSAYFFLGLLIVEFLSRHISFLDNQARWVKISFLLSVYLMLYFGHLSIIAVISYYQILTLVLAYFISMAIAIPLTSFFSNTDKNGVKI